MFHEKQGKRTDIIVLACTHYPFLVNRMRKMAPWPVDWIDTSEAIARRAASLIEPRPTAAEKGDNFGRRCGRFTGGQPDPLTAKLLRGFGLRPEPGS